MTASAEKIASLEAENARLRLKANTPRRPLWLTVTLSLLVGATIVGMLIGWSVGRAVGGLAGASAPPRDGIYGACEGDGPRR